MRLVQGRARILATLALVVAVLTPASATGVGAASRPHVVASYAFPKHLVGGVMHPWGGDLYIVSGFSPAAYDPPILRATGQGTFTKLKPPTSFKNISYNGIDTAANGQLWISATDRRGSGVDVEHYGVVSPTGIEWHTPTDTSDHVEWGDLGSIGGKTLTLDTLQHQTGNDTTFTYIELEPDGDVTPFALQIVGNTVYAIAGDFQIGTMADLVRSDDKTFLKASFAMHHINGAPASGSGVTLMNGSGGLWYVEWGTTDLREQGSNAAPIELPDSQFGWVRGADGRIWFRFGGANYLARLNPDGTITRVDLPAGLVTGQLAAGPGPFIWTDARDPATDTSTLVKVRICKNANATASNCTPY